MSRPNRPVAVATAALLLATGLSGAVASSAAANDLKNVQVSANNNPGSRQFFVEDLTGKTLTNLNLGTGAQGLPFQTRVKDTDYISNTGGFEASAVMTNLYRKPSTATATIDYATKVPSSKLSISYPGIPNDVADLSLGALPRVQLSGLLPLCKDLPALLPLESTLRTAAAVLDTTTKLPVLAPVVGALPGTLGTLGLSSAAGPLCTALGGVTGSTPVAVEAVDKALLTLDEKILRPALGVVDQQALTIGGQTAGSFDNPSYLGDGAGDPVKGSDAATALFLLTGQKNGGLNLGGLLGPILDKLALFPAVPGATGAVTEVSNVVAALQGSVDGSVRTVGTQLAGLSAADQTGVLSGLTALAAGTPIATLVDPVLTRISGQYRSFPQLKADLKDAAAGTYTGTMTVTFIQK